MLPPSSSLDPGDLEAQKRVEFPDVADDNESPVYLPRTMTSAGSRLPIEYRSLSIRVESKMPTSPVNRFPIEYRTLSIHVESKMPEETRKGEHVEKRKIAARGE